MIFLQSLLLVSVLTLIRSSLSTITLQALPGYVPVDNRLLPSGESGPSTNATSNQTSARHNSTSNRGAGDPCGPRSTQTDFQNTQTDIESTINTCGAINTTFTHAPSIYGVQCLHANPSWNQTVNVASCFSNLVGICQTITQGLAPRSQWSWSSGVCIYIYIFSSIFLRHPGSLPPSATKQRANSSVLIHRAPIAPWVSGSTRFPPRNHHGHGQLALQTFMR